MKTVEKADLEQMKLVDIRTVDRESLADIKNIGIDGKMPREQRFADFMGQIKNPYCFRCGKVVVKVSFLDTKTTLEDCLEHYLKSL